MLKLFMPLLSILFLFSSCGQKETEASARNLIAADLAGQTINLANFVSAKPTEILSSRSAIEIEFNRNMVLQNAVGEDLSVNPVEFEPAVKGMAKWLTTSLLQFTPSEPLQSGQAYKAVFNGKKAFGNAVNANNYNFEFKIIPNEVLEINGGFEPVPGKVNTAKLVLELRFADKPDSAKLRKELTLSFNSKSIPHKMFFDGHGNLRIESEAVTRTTKAQSAEIALLKSWSASGNLFSETFLLPAAGTFAVVSTKEASAAQGEKAYEVVFSDPIANDRDVSGFVSVSPGVRHKVSVRNRTLKVSGNFSYGVQYTLRIESGLPSAYGTKMQNNFVKQFSFNDEQPQLSWVGSGLFLPLENKGRLQFKSINLAAAELEIQEILPQNLIFFLQNNDLRSSNRWISDIERTAKKVYSKEVRFENPNRNEWLKTEIDISNYFAKKPGAAYIVSLKFNSQNLIAPCKNRNESYSESDLVYEDSGWRSPCGSYYYYDANRNSEKILIASSIALTAKKESDGVHIWATDVESSKPISGLSLELYGRVNDVLATQKTNSNGYVYFPIKKDEEGYIIKGQGNRGLALLKLNQANWQTSRFDVGGVRESSSNARLFSYTERGVYRPGDTIHFSGIAREGIYTPLANLPMSVSVRNPMGSVVFEGKAQTSANGMFSLHIPTDLNAPTGEWIAAITSGGNEWRHVLRVETVKPNRLKNTLELPEKMSGSEIIMNQIFQSKYLFGTPAAGLRAEINFSIKNKALNFPRFPDFTFKNQMLLFSEIYNETLFGGNLNSDGEARISKTINLKNRNIPEAATMNVHAVVNERGGGFTESWHSSVIYPYPVFVGLKTRDAWLGARTGDTLSIPIIALDENGRIASDRSLSVKIYQNRNYSWWEGNHYERWDFRTQQQTYLVHEEIIRSGTSAREFKWVPESDGLLAIQVEDVAGGHSAAQFVYASHWGGSENMRNFPEASHLNLTSRKNSYYTGDSILLSFDAPADGNALVSLEYANKILETRLVPAKAGRNEISFAASKNMLPNVYAVVSLFLPLKSVEGEKPMRYYGVLPIKIEDEKTKLTLGMNAPKEIKPGDEFTIEVMNHSKENASFTLAVVDEGLLDLTNFKTPDPWQFYFRKLALGVISSDNYDEIIGALMPDMDSYLSIGGDDEVASRAGQQRVQRFKPVSLFSGVQEVKAGKTEKIKFKMPQYVGSVRVQLVGVSQNAFSKNETNITVKKPLMILPTAPRATKPGDKFKVPVSVFAMDNDVKNASVHIQVSPELKIAGKSSFTLSFEKPGELDGSFDVEALPVVGDAKIIVRAESGRHKIADTIDLPLISSSAIYTDVLRQQVSAGNAWETKINSFGIDKTHRATLVLSTMPSLGADERLDYLINYPYGCLEQIVSGMFPQLYIDKFKDLDSKQKQEITNNLNDGIKRLSQYSQSKGFSYWPNRSGNADSWATSYAGHFMLEAKNAGYAVPQNLLNIWKSWEIDEVKKQRSGDFRNQAYRLFLLAMVGDEQIGAMNLMKENHLDKLDWLSRYLLASAYHAAGRETIAKQVLESKGNALSDYRENSGTYGSSMRDQALAALVLARMNMFSEALDIYRSLANEWNSRTWWSTQESAFALLAFSAIKDKFSSGDVEVEWSANGKTQKVLIKASKPAKIDLTSLGNAEISVNALNGTVFAELQTRGLPLQDNIKTEQKGLAMERTLHNQNGERISVSQIRPDEAFWLVFSVRSFAAARLENLALSSILPSGFEISNERLNEYNRPGWLTNMRLSTPDYMDIRDDRINWFFALNSNETKRFAVQIHP
ncbi:MAG: MG2 domain-containing protein, partial [Fibromonadales bacterium]|nr:MG2 domain-containing protein [Fibromonadales bacterium]